MRDASPKSLMTKVSTNLWRIDLSPFTMYGMCRRRGGLNRRRRRFFIVEVAYRRDGADASTGA